jgi:hypothetical protein
MTNMVASTPVFSDRLSTSFWRPFFTVSAECFTRPKASGLVPALVHGCSVMRFLLRSGEERGLNCNVKSFSKVFSAFAGDPCVFSLFLGVLCNKFVPPLLT